MSALLDIPVVADVELRRTLRAQIARLERQLPVGRGRGSHAGAVLLGLDELERIRDDLVRRIQERRIAGGEEQERRRRLREEMWLDPHAHAGVTVSTREVGEAGCTRWSSWFRLTVSSGCP